MAYEELKKGYSHYFGTPINKKLVNVIIVDGTQRLRLKERFFFHLNIINNNNIIIIIIIIIVIIIIINNNNTRSNNSRKTWQKTLKELIKTIDTQLVQNVFVVIDCTFSVAWHPR